MSEGFIHLWRQSIDSRVFKNAELWKVWTWCLMKATWQGRWAEMKTGRSKVEVWMEPGQFIFGRKTAAKELGMPESSVRNRMKKLKNMRNVDIKEDTQYSVVSIVNWDSYQGEEIKEDSKEDRQRTGKGQAKDTDKKGKKEKKERKQENKIEKPSNGAGKKSYGEYVLLTPDEHNWLLENFGDPKLSWCLDELNNYIGQNPGTNGKKYTSHRHVLQGWISKKYEKEHPAGKTRTQDYEWKP